jgi:hypothetical protein
VAHIALTRRRSAHGWEARLAAFLSTLGFALVVASATIQDYSYEITSSFADGVDDDATAPFFGALSNDGIKDSSKHEKPFRSNRGEVIQARSVDAPSTITRSALPRVRTQHPLPPKLLPSAEHRASGNASTDPV